MTTACPKLKLTYFDLAGRAEPIRVLLRLGGVAFEDDRIARDAFAQLKPSLPHGHVPVLYVGDSGEVIAETSAILRFVARLAGFYPVNDPVAALMVEEILIAINELSETKIIPLIRESDAEQKTLRLHAFTTTHLPTALTQLETRLQWMHHECALFRDRTQLYAHEIVLSSLVRLLETDYRAFVPANPTKAYPTITAIHETVQAAIAAPATSTPPVRAAVSQSTAPVARPTSLKLTYLDYRARGEFLRLALHIGGVAFEDERVTFDEVYARRAELPYGQVPVLAIDGLVLAQTFALLRYTGTLSGLYPFATAPLLAAKMDELIARVEAIYYAFQAAYEEKDSAKRRAMREQLLADGVLQNALASMEKRVAQWKTLASTTPFLFGETVTVADLAVYHIVDFLQSGDFDYVPVTIADEYATLVAIHGAVLAHPRVHKAQLGSSSILH